MGATDVGAVVGGGCAEEDEAVVSRGGSDSGDCREEEG